ncbi:glutamate-rich protein 1 isoform X2 [Rousettus aegyptiacus]|uniref:glutamate-rich protein 1 isoform X2 n=1 Tax=Rousettus aegyptiacus TaxID=9407 RepID=UPI00168D9686|nr:glutamate-rich protein 1 isoform X2 [Rousettus aegyptiacus]
MRGMFVGKVLQRLFPHVPRGQETRALSTPASENPAEGEKAAAEEGRCGRSPPPTGGPSEAPPGRRLYTVSLPPGGCIPCPPEPPSRTTSENSSSSDDAGGPDPEDPPKRRRIRKPKSKKSLKSPDHVHVGQAGFEKQQNLLPGRPRSWPTEGPAMSANKKRKLKKKQRIRKKREAGVPAGAPRVDFTYQPAGGSSEQEAAPQSDAEVPDASPEDAGPGAPGDARQDGAGEEAGPGTREKADGLLNFLKSTQEIYFYDGGSRRPDSALAAASEELLRSLQAGSVAPSDVLSLHRMKTLLLLQDPGPLQLSLDEFARRCAMPPDHARVISAFFNYWITHILPEKNSE